MAESELCTEGTAVISDFQFQGRGQQGTVWKSASGENVLISYLLRPVFLDVSDQFMFSKTIALGVKKFIERQIDNQYSVSLKWPNDIYVEGRKIAGILIENSLQNKQLRQSIAGIGININAENFPEELNAVSLFQLTHEKKSIKDLLPSLHDCLNQYYFMLQSMNFKQINSEYERSLYQFGMMANYEWEKKIIRAKITGTDRSGRLRLEDENGNEMTAGMKEIIFLRES
jgi:BirA family biotin operon repressor/biotin-[acetyl-CoA-carboxylase] ligase